MTSSPDLEGEAKGGLPELPVFDVNFKTDPFKFYATLREHGPVARVMLPMGLPVWVVTRFAEAKMLLSDPRLSNDPDNRGPAWEPLRRLFANSDKPTPSLTAMRHHMLNADPPRHTRLRKSVFTLMTPRMVNGLEPAIEDLVSGLLDVMEPHAEVDIIDSFGFPLAEGVIQQLLGADREAMGDFEKWGRIVISGGLERRAEIPEAIKGMHSIVTALVVNKRLHPDDALLSQLIHTSDRADQLSDEELVQTMFLLLGAGGENTINLVGNTIYRLLREPQVLSIVQKDPSRLPDCIEEVLRLDGPVEMSTFRHVVEPLVVGEHQLAAGDTALVCIAAANRDPREFENPDEFDIDRHGAFHLAFGSGPHHCLGAHLSRVIGRIAIGAFLERFPDVALASPSVELERRIGLLNHALVRLPVQLRVDEKAKP